MTTVITRKNVPFGLSLSKELVRSIDEKRGDVSRSKFVSRLLENNLQNLVTMKSKSFNKKDIFADLRCRNQDQQVSNTRGEGKKLTGQNSSPIVDSDYKAGEYKICAGKHCYNLGNNRMNIKYINNVAWFCDKCKRELIDLELVVPLDAVDRTTKKWIDNTSKEYKI